MDLLTSLQEGEHAEGEGRDRFPCRGVVGFEQGLFVEKRALFAGGGVHFNK